MKKIAVIFCIVFFLNCSFAQKIIYKPDSAGSNFSGIVTKVELTDTATILYFHMPGPVGFKFAIPKKTYIEDSEGAGNRLYLERWEGFDITKWITISNSDGFRYKLFFPPISKDTKKINYGESNPEGHWYIYKLNLTKNGRNFLNNKNPWTIKVGHHVDSLKGHLKNKEPFFIVNPRKFNLLNEDIILPKDLPDAFYGNWYDKYGTLILSATEDYFILDFRIHFYNYINKTGDHTYRISGISKSFEILSLEDESMTIRTNKLSTLNKKSSSQKIPEFLKGEWFHQKTKKNINITDRYFYSYDEKAFNIKDSKKSRIDYIVTSDDVFWIVVYKQGEYSLFSISKSESNYVLQPRGFVNDKYLKSKN